MRILLPPSEAKRPGGRGRPLDGRDPPADTPPLAQARCTVRDALAELVAGDPTAAAQALLLPPGVAAGALATNVDVARSPTTPALRRYAGIVYEGLDYAGAAPAVQRAAHRDVLIFSGLLGVVRGDEPVPDYRVPAKAVLPRVGVVGTFWRRHLDPLLAGPAARRLLGHGLVIDLRSGDYAAMWRPGRALRDRVVGVRVLSPLPRGDLGVISYTSKLGKGRLAAALLRAAADAREPRTRDDVAQAWIACGGRDARASATGLDLVTP